MVEVMPDDEDARWMAEVARGDKAAFARLFDRHQASVVRFAWRFVGSQARAEELAQEIFFKLYKSAKAWRPTAKFKTFLFRVATNHCLNEVRRGDYRVMAPQPENEDGSVRDTTEAVGQRPDEALEGKRLEKAVGVALEKMSERERAAFNMARFEGMAYRDIADALEASEAAVKSLIHRATLQVMKQVEALQQGLSATGSQA
jgi:RNA polymerase sigma-70 factor (ECF subfamily)